MRVMGLKDLRIVVGVGCLFILSLFFTVFPVSWGEAMDIQNSVFQVQASEQLSLAASEELDTTGGWVAEIIPDITTSKDISLTFDKEIKVPLEIHGQFTVKLDNIDATVKSVEKVKQVGKIKLTIDPKVNDSTKVIEVTYTKSDNPAKQLKSTDGETVESFSIQIGEPSQAPSLMADSSDNLLGNVIDITFVDDSLWRERVSNVKVNDSSISGKYRIEEGRLSIEADVFLTSGDYSIVVKAPGYTDATVVQTIVESVTLLNPPVLTADLTNNTISQAIDITFSDDLAWREAISDVCIDGQSANTKYSIGEGKITINAEVFNEARSYIIVVKAAGYNDIQLEQKIMQPSSSGGGGSGDGNGNNSGGGSGDGSGGGAGSGTPGGLTVLSFNQAKLAPSDTLLQFDFGNGMDKTLSSNLNKIRVYEKASGSEVKYSNYNYIKQGSGNDAVKLRRLELMFNNLKPGTAYVVELDAGFEANNGSTLGSKQSFEFSTSGTAAGGGAGVPADEKTYGQEAATVSEQGARIDIPAAAFDQDFKVKVGIVKDVTKLPLAEKSKLISDVVEIEKDKGGEFKKAVSITLSFDKAKVDSGKNDIQICYLDEKANKWLPLSNIKLDLTAGKISGETKHFTKFAVIATEKASVSKQKAIENSKVVKLSDIQGHWAQKAIEELLASAAIEGYPDGSFKPEQNITRAEFTSILVKALKLNVKDGKVFDDTAQHWAKEAIAAAAASGIVSGYSESIFAPDESITREQMAVMVVNTARLAELNENKVFSDAAQVSAWARKAVAVANAHSIISGYPDNSFRPRANASRAEAAMVIAKSLNLAA